MQVELERKKKGSDMQASLVVNCALAVCLLVFPKPANSMDFTPLEDGAYLVAQGEIASDDGERLRSILRDGSYAEKWLVLDSIGGSIAAALDMGRLLRRWNMKTIVPAKASCLSACLLAFLGGEERIVSVDGRLGSHQFYWSSDVEGTQSEVIRTTLDLSGQLLKHFIDLGAGAEALSLIMRTAPDEMYYFSNDELERFHLTGATVPGRRRGPAMLGKGAPRPGCSWPDDFLIADPLRLYADCY